MIHSRVWIFLILSSLGLILFVWQMIRRGKLRPAYGLLWLATSMSFFVIVLFRSLVIRLADFFGVDYPPALAFGFAILFIIVLILQHTSVLSSLARQNAELAEHVAILKWRVQQLEAQRAQPMADPGHQPSSLEDKIILPLKEGEIYP